MPDPGTPEFVEKYPFRVQVYRPYRKWTELPGNNFASASEAITIMNFLQSRGRRKGFRLRVVDMRSLVVVGNSRKVDAIGR